MYWGFFFVGAPPMQALAALLNQQTFVHEYGARLRTIEREALVAFNIDVSVLLQAYLSP